MRVLSILLIYIESTLHLVLRLRGSADDDSEPTACKRRKITTNVNVVDDDDENYESIDSSQMSGLSEHVV
ncbi:unnamed protein product, partial [Rotaria magnacalcarata]